MNKIKHVLNVTNVTASRHKTLNQYWCNFGPPSTTLGNVKPIVNQRVVSAGQHETVIHRPRHWPNVKSTSGFSVPFSDTDHIKVPITSLCIWKGVSATFPSRRYTISYPRRRNLILVTLLVVTYSPINARQTFIFSDNTDSRYARVTLQLIHNTKTVIDIPTC